MGIDSGQPSPPNQSARLAHIEMRLAERYPDLAMVAVHPTLESEETARRETQVLLDRHPHLGAIIAICAPAVPAAAETVGRAGRKGVKVIGMASPRDCRNSPRVSASDGRQSTRVQQAEVGIDGTLAPA